MYLLHCAGLGYGGGGGGFEFVTQVQLGKQSILKLKRFRVVLETYAEEKSQNKIMDLRCLGALTVQ